MNLILLIIQTVILLLIVLILYKAIKDILKALTILTQFFETNEPAQEALKQVKKIPVMRFSPFKENEIKK